MFVVRLTTLWTIDGKVIRIFDCFWFCSRLYLVGLSTFIQISDRYPYCRTFMVELSMFLALSNRIIVVFYISRVVRSFYKGLLVIRIVGYI